MERCNTKSQTIINGAAMKSTYQLKESLVAEYEWNKGPMPSGYAKLRLRLQSGLSEGAIVQVATPPNSILNIRPTKDAEEDPPNQSLKEGFMRMVVRGVIKGANEALAQSLDKPVADVIVVLEQVTVDIMYSTEMAFRMASRLAIETLLKQAADEGLLRVHNVDG
jgi:translation elongation factor EF-G